LKPDNILIGFGGVAKIGDFGCSLQMKDENQVMSSHVGSPAYMDGRVRAGYYDQSVDIYSLGMVFISIFKGKGIYDDCANMAELERRKSRI
jgi:fused-like protein